jgi:lipopolysaccharide transport system ATP-binding protein
MNDTVIKFENISKQYRLGNIGTGTLSHDLKRWWSINIRGKDDPYLKVGQGNSKVENASGKFIWALKDIDFEVKRGEVLGIIGKNGAGKSTLLKILSRVTTPTTGRILAKGRVASLLEVGTGFHPEMTGRENIYMNGSILGMSKSEITRKMCEIVDFAGVERFLDTPVKRYSSGMMVRLGFAIAAHLEPEILVVDEVLAVGDAEFQKKAIGKIQDVSQEEYRTVLFVSHNMNAVKSICKRAILLSTGMISSIGETDEIIKEYLNSSIGLKNYVNFQDKPFGDEVCTLLSARIINDRGDVIYFQDIKGEIHVEFSFKIKIKTFGIPNMHLFMADGAHIFFSAGEQRIYEEGIYITTLIIPGSLLNTGTYIVGLAFTTLKPYVINFYLKDALMFEIIEKINERQMNFVGQIPGVVRPDLNWEIKTVK